ncbi:uncharacterized protein ccdc141 [Fundulus diaphanus]
MTTGEAEGTEEPCGRRSKQEAGSRAAQLKPGGSCTALSTVAIQAGRSQIVASVLRSGSLVHLQLVQFQPGLCEIGSNQEENHVLIQEHQQLLEKLQKHEPEVLAVVEKNQPERPAKRRDGGRKEELKEIPSRGPVLRLEELVEALQDRRRRADQAFRLQLQKAEQVLEVKEESNRAGAEARTGSEKTRILRSAESTELQTGSWLDLKTEPESHGTKGAQTDFKSEPKNRSKSAVLGSGSKEGKDLRPASRSDETSKPRLDSRTSLPGSGPILRTRTHGAQTSVCDVKPGSTPDDTSTQLSGSRSEETGTRHAGSRPDGIRTPELICSSENISESASLRSASTEEPRSRSETTRTLPSESGSVGITDLLPRSRWKNQSGSGAPGSGSQDLKPLSGSERTRKEESKNSGFPSDLRTRLRSDERHKRDSDARPGSESAGTRTQQTGSRSEVSGSGSDLPSAKRQLHETKLGLNEQQADHQMEVQQQQEDQTSRSGHQERLVKTLQDLNCVSELLDSCSQMDLGSELQTSRLLEHFRQAEPHFRQLDAEVEHTVGGWESLQEELSELLKIQQTVKDKKQQSESILKLSSSFHDTARQMELLLQSEPVGLLTGSTGSTGSREAELSRLQEAKQQIQNLLHTTATLRTDICAAVSQSNWAGFQTEQLEGRLGSLDSVCESWLNEAGQCEAELRREHLTHLLLGDVTQLRESFKELKKRFSNTKFNYLKRNDRTRNLKAVRNQLQQMEAYQEKLQGLRKRVHGVAARLGPEVKNTCVARQVEDAVNELQRQTGQLERNISEHQKTLDMTCRLQQAMEEYQFWCEDASATIARVGRFSLECRSTEAVSVLYRQFEKFVWPTVPQQEERIGQITELAVRLHGVEEGQRYIEKTVSKHSEMVESIKELSDGLMELEAKLKLESLKQQQNDEEEEGEEEGEREHRRQTEEQEKKKETRRMQQRDNRSTQEAADMCELKETGHTPELIAKIDRNEAPEATRKPPLEKSPSQEVYGPTASRELPGGKLTSSTHILTACSPEDARQQVQATHNQSQAVTTEYKATPFQSGPLFPDNQEDFQREIEGTEQQMASSSCGSNTDSLQETQPEAMTEDFFFNDESDCASPDDISLPPLAETPESNMFQSDVEEGFCFSSLSVHVSHKCHAQSEPTGTASVQQKESGQTESCPAPSVSLQTSTRFRSESRSFTPSPSTVPLTSLFTSTLCTILKSKEPSTVFSLDNPVNVYDTIDCSKDKKALKKRSLSGTLKQDLSQSLHPQSFNGADTGLHNHSIPKGDTGVHEFSPSYTGKDCILPEKRDLPESHHGTTSQSHQGMHSVKYSGETTPRRDSRIKTSVSLVSQQNIYIRSSFSGNHCSNSHSDPVPKSERFSQTSRVTDPVLHKDVTQAQDEDFIEPSTTIPQRSTTPQDPNHSQNSTSSRGEPDQDAPSTLRNRSLRTTATDTQQRVFNQPFPSGQSQTDTISNQDPRDPPEGLVHSPTQPRSVSNAGICSSKQRLQASLTSSGTQQCVHDPSMSPSSAQPAPPHPEPQTHASPHPPNLHATSPCSPPRLLTPSQDPDICLPVAIREEIRLTPQIQGPALPPARLPQPSSESPPPRKPSEPGLPCFPRPWPHAMVMEGSPVTLEVEVKGNPEPRLTRGHSCLSRCLTACHHGRCRFTHEGAPPRHTDRDQNRDREQSQQLAGSSSGVGDKWLVLEALDVIMEDWNTWFGTLCVLLWLLYLILL